MGAEHTQDPEPSGREELLPAGPPPASGPLGSALVSFAAALPGGGVCRCFCAHCRMDVLLFPAASEREHWL